MHPRLLFSNDVLVLITNGAVSKRQWCWALNTLRYVAKVKATCYCHTPEVSVIPSYCPFYMSFRH